MGRGYTPTAEEFNRMMSECVEYKKLIKLQDQLEWFGDDVGGVSIISLKYKIKQRIKDTPKESRNFDTQVHGQTTNI